MNREPINLKNKLEQFSERWAPRIVADLNDHQLKLVKIQGEFVWHQHQDSDEAFMVIEGEMSIAFRDGQVDLKAGELFVVPRGVEHKPMADKECKIMLIECRSVINTGDATDRPSSENDVWI